MSEALTLPTDLVTDAVAAYDRYRFALENGCRVGRRAGDRGRGEHMIRRRRVGRTRGPFLNPWGQALASAVVVGVVALLQWLLP